MCFLSILWIRYSIGYRIYKIRSMIAKCDIHYLELCTKFWNSVHRPYIRWIKLLSEFVIIECIIYNNVYIVFVAMHVFYNNNDIIRNYVYDACSGTYHNYTNAQVIHNNCMHEQIECAPHLNELIDHLQNCRCNLQSVHRLSYECVPYPHECTRDLQVTIASSTTYRPTHSRTRSLPMLAQSLAHSCTRSLADSLAYSLTRSLIRSLTQSLTHSLTYLSTHSCWGHTHTHTHT
jgi:hypothetical protein